MTFNPILFTVFFVLFVFFYPPPRHLTAVMRESLHSCGLFAGLLRPLYYLEGFTLQTAAVRRVHSIILQSAVKQPLPLPPLKEHHYSKSRANFPLTEKVASATKEEEKNLY